jgi:hypothetical protein
MAERTPSAVKNLDRYGSEPLPWSRPRDLLAATPTGGERSFFLGTTDPDGRAHAAAVGAMWLDGALYFTSGPGTRKTRNLEARPACSLAVSLQGIDMIFEGAVARVTDNATLEALAALYRSVGWPAEVAGEAFTAPYSAPSAGPAPWNLYRMTIQTAYGVATAEPYGATRWRFDAAG